MEFLGLVPSSADESSSEEELLGVGVLFLFFFLVAVLELTFGVVDLDTSDAVGLDTSDPVDLVPLALLDEDLVTVTGFVPDPELHAVTLATSTLGILYVGGLSLGVSLSGASTSVTLLGGVVVGVLLLLDFGVTDLVGALLLGLLHDLLSLCLRSVGLLDLDLFLPLVLPLGSLKGRQDHGNL